jgi:hypothetical protein
MQTRFSVRLWPDIERQLVGSAGHVGLAVIGQVDGQWHHELGVAQRGLDLQLNAPFQGFAKRREPGRNVRF